MAVVCSVLTLFTFLTLTAALEANFDHGLKGINTKKPLIIGHRGASGVYPAHVLKSYQEAINQGADFIECDVIVSKDLEYLCVHDNWLSDVTNVQDVFPGCEETLYVPDFYGNITDCFAHRLTLEELKTLRVKQSYETRDPQYDLLYEIPTLQEFLQAARGGSRVVGIYPEPKNPMFVHGLDIWSGDPWRYERGFLAVLEEEGYTAAVDPCILQSFHYPSLLYMRNRTGVPCTYLRWNDGNPITDAQLDQYVQDGIQAVGPEKIFVVDKEGKPTDLATRAHDRGLKVHVWTFGNDHMDFIFQLDPFNEYAKHTESAIDGAFTDFPATYRRALELLYDKGHCTSGTVSLTLPIWMILPAILLVF